MTVITWYTDPLKPHETPGNARTEGMRSVSKKQRNSRGTAQHTQLLFAPRFGGGRRDISDLWGETSRELATDRDCPNCEASSLRVAGRDCKVDRGGRRWKA